MISASYYLNAFLWLVNAVVWFGYAHVAPMGVCSLGAFALSIMLARAARA